LLVAIPVTLKFGCLVPMNAVTARRLRNCALLAGAAVTFLLPLSARADTQPVSATVGSTLGITASGPVTLTTLLPGQTSTGSGSVTVIATLGWTLNVKDSASSNAGHLQRTSGSSGTDVLNHALNWQTSGTGVTGGSGSLSGTDATAATGNLARTVNVSYSQQADSDELLASGSVYGLTVTWTIS
jgi:hypothetical protein